MNQVRAVHVPFQPTGLLARIKARLSRPKFLPDTQPRCPDCGALMKGHTQTICNEAVMSYYDPN